MRILISGICGFVGSTLAARLLRRREGLTLFGVDNLQRPGSELNRSRLRDMNVKVFHGDIRMASDFETLPAADWVIDAAANASVLAGVRGNGSSRQLFENNLSSLVNILEYCKTHGAGLLLISSSRVYSILQLNSLPLREQDGAFVLNTDAPIPAGLSERGIDERFPTAAPVSLYGGTKLAAELLSLEYGNAFGFPVWITRCGVMAGAGQFGTPDQGIFAYWVNAHLRKRPLRYFGFGGRGWQVRDALHPDDLAALLDLQMRSARTNGQRLYVAGGGTSNAMSLANLTAWCDERFGPNRVMSDQSDRPFDIPWMIMDSLSAQQDFGWAPEISLHQILDEIAGHAYEHPDWLERSGL